MSDKELLDQCYEDIPIYLVISQIHPNRLLGFEYTKADWKKQAETFGLDTARHVPQIVINKDTVQKTLEPWIIRYIDGRHEDILSHYQRAAQAFKYVVLKKAKNDLKVEPYIGDSEDSAFQRELMRNINDDALSVVGDIKYDIFQKYSYHRRKQLPPPGPHTVQEARDPEEEMRTLDMWRQHWRDADQKRLSNHARKHFAPHWDDVTGITLYAFNQQYVTYEEWHITVEAVRYPPGSQVFSIQISPTLARSLIPTTLTPEQVAYNTPAVQTLSYMIAKKARTISTFPDQKGVCAKRENVKDIVRFLAHKMNESS